jgi:hypothetical protein
MMKNAAESETSAKELAASLMEELGWLAAVLKNRLQVLAGQQPGTRAEDLPSPAHAGRNDALAAYIRSQNLSRLERLLLILTLAPHLKSDFFDQHILEVFPQGGELPQLGGSRGKQHRGFLPTGETFLFLASGNYLPGRIQALPVLDSEAPLVKSHMCWLEEALPGEPRMSGALTMSPEWVELFTFGAVGLPRFSMQFPAQRLVATVDWNDLVLPAATLSQIREIETWLQHGHRLDADWGLGKYLRPGYRALFHGPPGTGKTLTASLLGKLTGREVFRVDLSMVMSKFIGETEKNLSALFDRAGNKGWILFFDEADALFSKRTQVRDAHDKYANQEVSYLLQRTEIHDGLIILASNLKSNIDDAFLRRFQNVIHFPLPKPAERLRMWERFIPPQLKLDPELSLSDVAAQFELSGAAILNVIQFACLRALGRGDETLMRADVQEGVRREFQKENKLA